MMPVEHSPTRPVHQDDPIGISTSAAADFPVARSSTGGMAHQGSGTGGRTDDSMTPGDSSGVGEVKAVRLPRLFWRDNPARYFLVAKMTFVLHRIISDE